MFKNRKVIIIILIFVLAFSLIGCEGADLSKDQNDELAKKKKEDTHKQTDNQKVKVVKHADLISELHYLIRPVTESIYNDNVREFFQRCYSTI